MLTGNKGEWSELYVLVTLLADGILNQSDFQGNKDFENIYEIIKAYKDETDHTLEFQRNGNVVLYKVDSELNKELVKTYSYEELKAVSEKLLNGIVNGKGRAFPIKEVDDFINDTAIQKLKANSGVKADLKLRIYDHRLAKETDLGFSIKSLLGGNSTLFNTGPGNNFIFDVKVKLGKTINHFNSDTYKPKTNISKLTFRLQELNKLGADFKFNKIQSINLWRNLKLIDGDLPEIMAWALYYRWIKREPSLLELSEILEQKDPLNFYNGAVFKQGFYTYKIKKFLAEAAMGMTSEKPWVGEYDSFGGVILVKKDGDLVCFHIYDFNLFRKYLLENTIFEQPSTGEDPTNPGNPRTKGKKYFYGWLYQEDNKFKFKINLQVRFK